MGGGGFTAQAPEEENTETGENPSEKNQYRGTCWHFLITVGSLSFGL